MARGPYRFFNYILILSLLFFLYLIRMVLIPFFLGLLLTYLLHPLVKRLTKKGLTVTLSILIIYGWLLLIVGAILLYVSPLLVEELEDLAFYLPHYFQDVQEFISFIDGEYRRIHLPSPLQQMLDEGLVRMEALSIQLVERLTRSIFSFLTRLPFLLLSPVISFYLLRDLTGLKRWAVSLIPLHWQVRLLPFFQELDALILAFFRGQLLLTLIIAFLSTIAYLFLQVKFALVFGLFTGFMNLIPYLGPILGVLPPFFYLLFQDSSRVLWLLGIIIVMQQVETAYIAPRIMSQELGLHPLTILFSLLVGGELFGIVGMVLSIPGAFFIKTAFLFFFFPRE